MTTEEDWDFEPHAEFEVTSVYTPTEDCDGFYTLTDGQETTDEASRSIQEGNIEVTGTGEQCDYDGDTYAEERGIDPLFHVNDSTGAAPKYGKESAVEAQSSREEFTVDAEACSEDPAVDELMYEVESFVDSLAPVKRCAGDAPLHLDKGAVKALTSLEVCADDALTAIEDGSSFDTLTAIEESAVDALTVMGDRLGDSLTISSGKHTETSTATETDTPANASYALDIQRVTGNRGRSMSSRLGVRDQTHSTGVIRPYSSDSGKLINRTALRFTNLRYENYDISWKFYSRLARRKRHRVHPPVGYLVCLPVQVQTKGTKRNADHLFPREYVM